MNIICTGLCCLLRLLSSGVKTLHVSRIFHVAWIFVFFLRWCVCEGSASFKINVSYSLYQTFFTLMLRQNQRKQFIFIGDHPYCSLHLSTLFSNSGLLCTWLNCDLAVFVWGRWGNMIGGRSWSFHYCNTLHPWWIRSVWFADLASWHQTSIEHTPRRHHRVGKIPQCPAFTLGLLIR